MCNVKYIFNIFREYGITVVLYFGRIKWSLRTEDAHMQKFMVQVAINKVLDELV